MSSRDKLIEQLIRNQLRPKNATRRLQEQLMEQQAIAFRSVNKAALEAVAQAGASARQSAVNALIQLSQTYSAHVRMMAEVGQSLIKSRDEMAAVVTATLRNVDLIKIRGNSINAAVAALMAEKAKSIELLRETFAFTVAEALKQALEHLSERDEKAFARLEQLIDEKIATLPNNQVTAEGLWKYLVALFVALASLGVSLYQARDAKQTSKTQAEFQAQIMNVLERIANRTNELAPKQDQNTYYVVERKVNLKLKPKNSSPTIATISSNQKTRMVQMNHKWIYVEYFDYLEGVPKYGWAKKKYLKKVDS